MMFVNINDIAILNIQGVYYCCIISRISESEALNLLRNAEENGTLNITFVTVYKNG